jgi:tetratricopeptide (TPR) repeat protein
MELMRFFFMNSDSGNPASGKGTPKPKTPFYLPKQILGFLFFWFFSVSLLTAQTEQEQNVAKQYLEQGEFQKALAFYERFYQQRPDKHTFFLSLLQIYAALESTDQAKTLAEKHFRKWPSVPSVLAAYVDVQLRFGEAKLAEKALKSWSKNPSTQFRDTEELANALAVKGHLAQAIQALEDWVRRSPNRAEALNKLVDLYVADNKPLQASNQLIQLLYLSPGYYEGIKSRLVNLLSEDPEAPINLAIKQAFISEIQKNPEELELASLLMWVFIQETNFSQAFVHAKSIDQRSRAEGRILLDLGTICREQQAYDMANRCFLYVGGLGEFSPYYLEAKMAEVQNMEDWLRWEGRLLGLQLEQLQTAYESVLKVLPLGPNFVQTMLRYTRLLAFDLGRKEDAVVYLTGIMSELRSGTMEEAQAKITLADILIATGDLWEPSLLYGQVEKSLPNSLEGHEAKWGNTRLSFFRGEFTWAQTQAKVLKASTTKHIANDALGLSLLINDLMGEDSNTTDLARYARAEWAFYSRNDALAALILDSIQQELKFGPILTASLWIRFQLLERKAAVESAIEALRLLIKNDSSNLLVDDAYLAMGRLYENQLGQPEKAMEAYRTLLIDYPGSLHNQTARVRYRILKAKTNSSP